MNVWLTGWWSKQGGALACAGAAVITLAGCAASTPAPVLLTIPPSAVAAVAAAAPAASAASAAPILAVRRVAIPEYLVARRVRYRADPSTLAEWPNTYWAERVEIGVSREFTAALRAQLPGWTLCEANCADQVPLLALQVELVPMDYLRGTQTLTAHARLTLSTGSAAPKVLATQDENYALPSGADSAQAQALAIAELLRRVAALAAPMVGAAVRQSP